MSKAIKITLTLDEVKILKEALLCAEVNRNKDFNGTGDKFAQTHMNLDEKVLKGLIK